MHIEGTNVLPDSGIVVYVEPQCPSIFLVAVATMDVEVAIVHHHSWAHTANIERS
jgi:hypothetical protein